MFILLFFLIYLAIGLSIYQDFGISWDEEFQRRTGQLTFDYVFKDDPSLLDSRDKYYGVAFEIPLLFLEKALPFFGVQDSRQIFLMRHLMTFLLFYSSTIFFYFLGRRIFNDWKISLLGTAFLVLSPRIFGHSFYNPKDIPLLSLFIISAYTLMRYLEKKTVRTAVLHALACAILVDIRIVGILMPILTLLLAGLRMFSLNPPERKKILILTSLYGLLFVSLTVFFWPILWSNPWREFLNAIKQFSRYPHAMDLLYMGRKVSSANLPWDYIPVWIGITTPLLYTFTFIFGTFILLKSLFKKPFQTDLHKLGATLFLTWFFVPILTTILIRSVLFDSWRHLFFVYPAFIMISTIGMERLFIHIKTIANAKTRKSAFFFIVLAILSSFLHSAYFIIRSHPYEQEYFNILFSWNLKSTKDCFEMVGWGLPYREALEHILEKDTRETIKVCVAALPGRLNANILKPEQRKRLSYAYFVRNADYYLTDSIWLRKDELQFPREFYSVKIDGAKLLRVYKVR